MPWRGGCGKSRRRAEELALIVERVARDGGTPLVVAGRENGAAHVLGVIYLKDVVKGGIRDRFVRLRAMGIRTVISTAKSAHRGGHRQEAGVDDFLVQATPKTRWR